jgi:hypothetical protein
LNRCNVLAVTDILCSPLAQRIGPNALDLSGHLGSGIRELSSHGGGQINHLDASAIQTDLFQQMLHVLNTLSGAKITFQVMAFSRQSTGYQDTVSVQRVKLACARQLDHLDGRRILQAQTASQVSSRVGTVTATEGHDVGFEAVFGHGRHHS